MGKVLKTVEKRKNRVRYMLSKCQGSRLRLTVLRTHKHLYAQLVDDVCHVTMCAASSLDAKVKEAQFKKEGSSKKMTKTLVAHLVGELVAQRAVSLGFSQVVFDRGPYVYHGRVKALAEGARHCGLSF